MYIGLVCFLKTKHIHLKPNTYSSILVLGKCFFFFFFSILGRETKASCPLISLLHSIMKLNIKFIHHSQPPPMQEKRNGSVYYLNNPAVIIYSLGVNYLGHSESRETTR